VALSASSADLEGRELQLSLQRRAAGTASDADIERLRTQLSQTRADLLPLKATLDQYLDQLALLTGREPGALDSELAGSAPPPLPPSSVAIGDPAAMIRRRPDIRQAERQLAAENAAIGQHVADYFPTVTLLGTVGYAGTQTSGLFDSRNVNALGGPSLSWNVLNLPKVQAQVKEAKAQYDTALFNYEQTVLAALQDAEDSLSRFGHQRENVVQLTAARDSAARAAELTRARYAGGTASLIDLLDTERQRVSTEESLAQAQALLTDDYVALQKSLGLGWQDALSSSAPKG
jgi:NodT family efflux transporter outer membrane factor (OMF) lipoprotein